MPKKNKTNFFALLVAEFFFLGRFPIAPGTIGTLGSLFIWVPSLYFNWPFVIKALLLIGLFFIGLWASAHGIAYYKNPDPKQVVIDEVVGQGILFLAIAKSPMEIILSFLLFRLFDITKPWPIKTIEQKLEPKWGIMVDDVVAGIYALVTLLIVKNFFT